MDINQKLTEELDVNRWQIDAAVTLIDEGNTIPFISRYRKEATGSLNDEQLRKLHERLLYLRNLEEKKEQVISSIEEQGKMTEELKEKIGIKKTIKDYGVDEKYFLDTLDDMTEQAFNDQCTGANPRYPLMSEMKEIYLKCYYGK